MKKKILYFLLIFLIFILLLFLFSKSPRYTGINYSVIDKKISNFQKINELFERDKKYKTLVKKINNNEKNKNNKIIKTSRWVYKNINKINYDVQDDIIDSHPWTIIERRMGVEDQFSDILSVLLIYNNINSFFIEKFNGVNYSFTLFEHEKKWSLIDPYYGIYFLNKKNQFCSLKELKNKNCNIYHLEHGIVSKNLINKIFFNKNFKNMNELQNYFQFLFEDLPSSTKINNTNIYKRGGRSYVQKPLHRLNYQIQKSLNLIN